MCPLCHPLPTPPLSCGNPPPYHLSPLSSLNVQFFSNMSLLSIFSSPHHHKNNELHKIFTSLPSSEKLVDGESEGRGRRGERHTL